MAAVKKPDTVTATGDPFDTTPDGATPGVSLRAAVRDYFALLEAQLKGYRTESSRRRWWSAASADESTRRRHHGQISAILLGQGLPYVRSRPPLPTGSSDLRQAVADYLRNHPEVFTYMEAAVFRHEPERDHSRDNLHAARIRRPPPYAGTAAASDTELLTGADFLAAEQRNRSLAQAGERFVIALEQHRLALAGLQKYADAIEHTSADTGDRAGYDIQSWTEDGSPLFIRVKTTRFGPETPCYLTTHELALARAEGPRYAVYRVFDYADKPRVFVIPGPLEAHSQLAAVTYRATLE